MAVTEPDDEEISWIGLMSEQRCPEEVIVQSWDGLTRINVTEFHERRFILRFKDERHTQVELGHVSVS